MTGTTINSRRALAAVRVTARCLLLTALFGVAQVSGVFAQTPVPVTVPKAAAEKNVRVFEHVWKTIKKEYYDPELHGLDWDSYRLEFRARAEAAGSERELYTVLNEMLSRLNDFHTWAASPSLLETSRARQYIGTGLAFDMLGGRAVVSRISPSSPAAASGILPGWTLIRVNGKSVTTPKFTRGIVRAGDTVELSFQKPDGAESTVWVKYAALPSAAGRVAKVLPSGTFYLAFSGFDDETGKWFVQMVEEHRNAPSMVIDLRFNGGGRIAALRSCLDALYATKRPLAYFVARDGELSALETTGRGDAAYPGQVIVLVNSQSRSASEMFAAIIQETGRGRIVGRRTAGAVLNSFEVDLPDGGRLNISRRDFRTREGRRFEGTGVLPDLVVEASATDVATGRDPELDAALTEVEAAFRKSHATGASTP